MAGPLDRLYARLPVPLQHLAVSAYGVLWRRRRLGGRFAAEVQGFVDRERFSTEEWRAYQTLRLRELLLIAATRVPYYRRAWAREHLGERRIAAFELADLQHLPLLEKQAVRDEPEAFLLDGRPARGMTVCPTSGSTGTPVRTYWTDADFQRSLALREARGCRPFGVSYLLPRATFSGRLVEPDAASRGPFHRFNWAERQVYFSAFHLAPQNAAAYLSPLRRHRTVWATGYTHAFAELAEMMLAQGLAAPPSLRAIITTSEKLNQTQRRTIQAAFHCPVAQEYGQVEDAVWACEGPDGRMRVSPDAGVLELLDKEGRPIPADREEEGEVVATSFIRRSQLLIRYRLGDVARFDPEPDPTGQSRPILKEILGRIEDVVVGPDGRRTVRFHGIFTELAGVREAQVIQEERDRLRILVVPAPGFGEETVAEIQRRVQQRLGAEMRVDVERVSAIPRTPAGKLQAVVSRLR